jgi:hypothetical protein
VNRNVRPSLSVLVISPKFREVRLAPGASEPDPTDNSAPDFTRTTELTCHRPKTRPSQRCRPPSTGVHRRVLDRLANCLTKIIAAARKLDPK